MATSKKVAKKAVAQKTTAKKVPAKKKVVVKKTVALDSKDYISLVIKTRGEVFEFKKTDSISDSIQSLGLSYTNTVTIIAATFKGKTVEKVLNVHMARRLFRSEVSRMSFEKQVRLLLGA